VRQLLTESTLLALAGGAVGIALAMLGLAVLRGLATHALPANADLSLDSGALLFAAALALLTGFGFGLAPAMSVSHSDTQSTLRDETRGSSESRRSRQLRGLLVAGQIALCVSLLAGAGLLARSLWAMTNTPLGFETEGVLTAGVQLPGATYSTPEAQRLFFERFEERLRSLPGVVSVADASGAPSNVQQSNGIAIVGEPPLVPQPFILYSSVSDQFFRAVGVPLKSGRTFGPEDNSDSTPTIIISEAMARKFWPRGGALGAQFRMGPDASSIPFTVVGIVGDVRNDPAHAEAAPMMYGPSRIDARPNRVVLLRTRGDPLALVQPLRRELAAMDPGVPLRKPTALHDLVGEKLTGRQLPVVLMSAFGVLALILASVGVYAMFAAMAAAREREFGVRMALGSTRAAIAGLVLRQGAIWMAVGLVIGAVGVTVISRFLRGLLYGVSQFDPVALGLAVLMLIAFGAVALLVPVRRATRVDPISVLR
jgi:predicted permease